MDTQCPNCHADWRSTELIGSARSGGGYEVRCHICGHQWDDMHASHGAREALRRPSAEADSDHHCDNPNHCSTCLNERAVKATARRSARSKARRRR